MSTVTRLLAGMLAIYGRSKIYPKEEAVGMSEAPSQTGVSLKSVREGVDMVNFGDPISYLL